MKNKFTPHGEFTLAWHGDVLLVTYAKVWNPQAVQALHHAAQAMWSPPPRRPWAMLTDARDWLGSSPEVFERWWIFYQDAVANGMSTVTDVLPSRFHELVVKDLMARAAAVTTFRHSHDMEEAWQWLALQGFGLQLAHAR